MKKIILLALLIITCIAAAGCIAQKTAVPSGAPSGIQAKDTVLNRSSDGALKAPLNVSIGNYDAKLPVYVDNISFGEVSPGKPLDILVNEGIHTVKICEGSTCNQVDVDLQSRIKTSLDFGDSFKSNSPEGPLSVSVGNYIGNLHVDIDGKWVGRISRGTPLNISVSEGRHTVVVYSDTIYEQQDVEISSGETAVVDFGERLIKAVPQGALTVSVGGYKANEIPVFIDDANAGNVSQGKQLDLKIGVGLHTVKVCVGMVCVNESVDIKFGQPSHVDFGEQLKKEIEFPEPTVHIKNFLVSDTVVTINTEFINPDITDHTMTATVGCGYSYIDWQSDQRKNDFARTEVSKFVKAGDRQTQQVILYLNGGSHVIASEPTIVDMEIL